MACLVEESPKELMQITVEQARAVEQLTPGQWVVSQTDGGWTVAKGGAVLASVNSKQPRIFRSLDTVARKLKEEIGVTQFQVEALKQ